MMRVALESFTFLLNTAVAVKMAKDFKGNPQSSTVFPCEFTSYQRSHYFL